MRLRALLPFLLVALPVAASASASASVSVSIRIVSREWLATHDSRLLASPRTVAAISKGMIEENGSSYLLLDIKGNTFKFEVPKGTVAPQGPLQVAYIPLRDEGRQRLVAMAINDRNLR